MANKEIEELIGDIEKYQWKSHMRGEFILGAWVNLKEVAALVDSLKAKYLKKYERQYGQLTKNA